MSLLLTRFIFILLLLGLCVVQATPLARLSGRSDSDLPSTNAERLARGLPLKAPRTPFSPTRVKRQQPSAMPFQIEVRRVVPAANPVPSYYDGSQVRATTTVNFVAASAGFGSPSTIQSLADSKYVALGSNSGAPSLISASSANSIRFLATTTVTPAGSTPQRETPTSARYLETTIWTVDPITKRISAQFINYDGSRPATYFVQQGAYLYGVGSVARFMSIASGSFQVELYAV